MSTNVLLHINVLRTADDKRAKFYQLLEASLWVRLHPVYTSWRCGYKSGGINLPDAVISEIRLLAASAGVVALHAVAQCGNTQAFCFEYNAVTQSDLLRL